MCTRQAQANGMAYGRDLAEISNKAKGTLSHILHGAKNSIASQWLFKRRVSSGAVLCKGFLQPLHLNT